MIKNKIKEMDVLSVKILYKKIGKTNIIFILKEEF